MGGFGCRKPFLYSNKKKIEKTFVHPRCSWLFYLRDPPSGSWSPGESALLLCPPRPRHRSSVGQSNVALLVSYTFHACRVCVKWTTGPTFAHSRHTAPHTHSPAAEVDQKLNFWDSYSCSTCEIRAGSSSSSVSRRRGITHSTLWLSLGLCKCVKEASERIGLGLKKNEEEKALI